MTGCLLYAARDHELDESLAQWRRRWDEANALERAFRDRQAQTAAPAVAGVRGTAPAAAARPEAGKEPVGDIASEALTTSRRPTWRWRPNATVRAVMATLTLLVIGLVEGDPAHPQPAMTGLYNIAMAPLRWVGPAPHSDFAGRLQTALYGELKQWSGGIAAIQLRGPQDIAPIEPDEAPARDRALAAVAREHNADVVLTGLLESSAGRLTVTIELFLSDRTFGETPEFVGRHEIRVVEPLDVFGENLTVGEDLVEATLHHVKGVVAFVRGLGDYARDDYAGAESRFTTAAAEFDLVEHVPGDHTVRKEVLYLMLGNAVGRGDIARVTRSAGHYRRALSYNPDYLRAKIGLAEATRAAVRCEPHPSAGPSLRLAVEHYRAALASGGRERDAANAALLQMKTRLGLGLAYQCLTLARQGSHWAEADAEFATVLGLHAATPLSGGGARYSLRLAAEARAGQALVAFATANQGDTVRYGGYPAAASAYEEALRLLGHIDVTRPDNVRRELVFLRNLRSVYEAMHETRRLEEVDERISDTSVRLATMADDRSRRR